MSFRMSLYRQEWRGEDGDCSRRWLQHLLIVLKCSWKWGDLTLRHDPQLTNTAWYQVFIMAHLQNSEQIGQEIVRFYARNWNLGLQVKSLSEIRSLYTIRTPPWKMTRPWISASTASKSWNTEHKILNYVLLICMN